MDFINATENKDALSRYFNDEYVKHVESIKHTITLQLDTDLKQYLAQLRAIIVQMDSMRELVEQIHAQTIKEERVFENTIPIKAIKGLLSNIGLAKSLLDIKGVLEEFRDKYAEELEGLQ